MILQSFAVYGLALLAGFGLMHLIWKTSSVWAFLLKIFLGAGLGLGLTSCLYFLRLLLLPGQSGYLLIQLILLAIIVFTLIWKKRFSISQRFNNTSYSLMQILIGLSALIVTAVSAYYVLTFARIAPHGDYDAQAIWNLRARFIFRLGDAWRNSFSPLVNRNFHLDYPILMPLNVVGGWNVLGSEVLRVPAVLSAIFLFAMAGVIFSALAYLRSPAQGATAWIVLLATPLVLRYGTFQTSDIAVAYYLISAAVLFVLAEREQHSGLYFLAGMVAALSAWTKNEGLPFLVIFIAFTLVASSRSQKLRNALSTLAGAALPVITIVLFKSLLSARNDLFEDNGLPALVAKLIDPVRYLKILSHLAIELTQLGGWPLSILLVLGLYAWIMGKANVQYPAERRVWVLPLLQLGVYLLVYLITPNDLDWQLNYSMSRLLIQIFPMTLFAYFLMVNTPEAALKPETHESTSSLASELQVK